MAYDKKGIRTTKKINREVEMTYYILRKDFTGQFSIRKTKSAWKHRYDKPATQLWELSSQEMVLNEEDIKQLKKLLRRKS